MSVKSKYDAHEEKKNMHMIRKLFEVTKLDGNFQRRGGVDNGSGWSINASNEYIASLMSDSVFNKIIVADIECCLLYAKRMGDAASEKYFQTLWDAGYKYVSIDGNNTSSTIAAFLDGHEKIHFIDDVGAKKTFANLTQDEQDDVMYTEKLDVATLRQIGIEEMCRLFQRLNVSTSLNAQEHRQARWSEMSQFVRDVSNLPEVRTMFTNFVFHKKSLDKRSHEETVAQLAMKISTNRNLLHKGELDKFYKSTSSLTEAEQKEITEILRVASKMAKEHGVLANSKGTRLSRGQLLVLFDVIREITTVRGYKIKGYETVFKWFAKKDHELRQASKTVTAEDAREKSYQFWTEQFVHRGLWERSLAKMMESFEDVEEEWVDAGHLVRKRTSADTFTQSQKEELLYLQEGQTRKGEQIDIFDLYDGKLEADHVVSVKDGGATEISNGELMYTEDNRTKGPQSSEPFFNFQQDLLDEI
jgi:hypothetical protein